jgi:hypothetical protein
LKIISIIIGIALAAAGGALTYHALFIEGPRADIITSTGVVHQMPDLLRIAGGILMLIVGAGLAFFSLRRTRL